MLNGSLGSSVVGSRGGRQVTGRDATSAAHGGEVAQEVAGAKSAHTARAVRHLIADERLPRLPLGRTRGSFTAGPVVSKRAPVSVSTARAMMTRASTLTTEPSVHATDATVSTTGASVASTDAHVITTDGAVVDDRCWCHR